MADDRFALLIASSRYADDTLTQLRAPARDAASLEAVLAQPEIGGFKVASLVDQPSTVVAEAIEAFFDGRRRGDLVLLYFSGHGILDQSSRLYFATTDTRVDRPRSTAIAASFVNDLMTECGSRRQVLILDCCNSGAFARGQKAGRTSVGTRERFEGRGRMVITASDALEYAFEADGTVKGEAAGSVFTDKLVEGLRTGEADRDRDGWVSLDELYDYAYDAVLDTAPRQRPGKWAFGVEGRLLIARSVRQPSEAGDPIASSPETSASDRRAPAARRRIFKRAFSWRGLAGLAVAAAAAVVGVLLLFERASGSPQLTSENRAALTVYDAWRHGKLDTLAPQKVGAHARSALAQMPTSPVTPNAAAPGDCYGTPAKASCEFDYPAIGVFLSFDVYPYPEGFRVDDVTCYNDNTDKPEPGGIPACARLVRRS
jgi:hypothetical protein